MKITEKTVIIPASQLIKANGLLNKLKKELLNLKPDDNINNIIEKLKDSITITY